MLSFDIPIIDATLLGPPYAGKEDAIASFIAPPGFTLESPPPPSKSSRSIIYDYGVRVEKLNLDGTLSGEVRFLCLASEPCYERALQGLGIRILGSLTNCTNHIRDVHKAESERSKLFQKRKEENGGSVESDDTEHSNSAKKSRMRSPPHSAERAADVDGIMISRASILHRVQFLEETAESLRREADALRKLL